MMLKTALTFGETELPTDPFAAFRIWLGEAEGSEINDPNAMSLATVDADGLLCGFISRGDLLRVLSEEPALEVWA